MSESLAVGRASARPAAGPATGDPAIAAGPATTASTAALIFSLIKFMASNTSWVRARPKSSSKVVERPHAV